MKINSFYLSLKLQLHLFYIPKITNAACQHIEIQEQYMSS